MAEQTFRQSLIMSQGSGWIFFKPPIALPIMIAAAIIFAWPMITMVRNRMRKTRGAVSKA
jgi:TctA family transporter